MASLVKELQEFMSADPYGRKVEISEFKELTTQDKHDLRELLITTGREVDPLPPR